MVHTNLVSLMCNAVDAWHERGFAGGMIIPAFISPTQLVIFPLALKVMDALNL